MQVVGQRPHRDPGIGIPAEIEHQIHHGKERGRIDPVLPADLGNRLVAEAERNAEATHYLQNRITVADQIAHPVLARISAILIHHTKAFYLSRAKITLRDRNGNT